MARLGADRPAVSGPDGYRVSAPIASCVWASSSASPRTPISTKSSRPGPVVERTEILNSSSLACAAFDTHFHFGFGMDQLLADDFYRWQSGTRRHGATNAGKGNQKLLTREATKQPNPRNAENWRSDTGDAISGRVQTSRGEEGGQRGNALHHPMGGVRRLRDFRVPAGGGNVGRGRGSRKVWRGRRGVVEEASGRKKHFSMERGSSEAKGATSTPSSGLATNSGKSVNRKESGGSSWGGVQKGEHGLLGDMTDKDKDFRRPVWLRRRPRGAKGGASHRADDLPGPTNWWG